jgi:hypothetical protein
MITNQATNIACYIDRWSQTAEQGYLLFDHSFLILLFPIFFSGLGEKVGIQTRVVFRTRKSEV